MDLGSAHSEPRAGARRGNDGHSSAEWGIFLCPRSAERSRVVSPVFPRDRDAQRGEYSSTPGRMEAQKTRNRAQIAQPAAPEPGLESRGCVFNTSNSCPGGNQSEIGHSHQGERARNRVPGARQGNLTASLKLARMLGSTGRPTEHGGALLSCADTQTDRKTERCTRPRPGRNIQSRFPCISLVWEHYK